MSNEYQLKRSTPEKQGISSAAILSFINDVEQTVHEMHSFMLLRHGCVVAEGWWSPYAPQRPHMLFSLSKSFTSTAIGLAVAEGRLSVDDPVLSFFPKDAPTKISANLAAMRVRHLLSMSTGHAKDTMGRIEKRYGKNWVKAFLALPVEYEPGTYFLYNTGASYMLSAIVQKVTGMKLLDYLEPRLFAPLGIRDATWETSPQGINMGGYGLTIKTEEIARFGQLYLQKGVWNGNRILPESWIAEATSFQVPNTNTQTNPDWSQGYGYQFWRCRHNAYRGDGAFGQYCLVMPDQDTVLAITSGLGDMQAVLTLVWDKLLPALGPTPLPDNPSTQDALYQRLKGLSLLPPAGMKTSPLAKKLSGKTFKIEANKMTTSAITFTFSNNGDEVVVSDARGEHVLSSGKAAWQEGFTTLFERGPQPIVTSGIWTAEDTYVLTLRAYETPFYYTMSCHFQDDTLTVTSEMNVSFEPAASPILTGHIS
jgi:Beta-lactamase